VLFAKTVLLNRWIKQKPTAKQRAFLELDGLEALYGGAAGGGKSSCLLMAALQYVDEAGYNAIILRRTYRDLALPGALMDRSKEWLLGSAARWNEIEHCWTFPSGARLQFGYLESEADKYRYQGAEFQGIFPDELTQFTESQYTYLFSRLRRLKESNVPLRLWGASNPGGLGHNWVKQRFIVEGEKYGRAFVPARLKDNPFLDQASYELSLQKLDPVTRKQLLEGCWEAQVGTMFHRDWFRVVEPQDVPSDLRKIRFWDLASTEADRGKDPDWTAGVLAALDKGQLYVFDVVHFRGSPKQTEDKIRKTAEDDGKDVQVWMEEEGGSSGKIASDHYARHVLLGFNFHAIRSTGDKVTRAGPLSSCTERRNVLLVRGNWINAFLDEAEVFPEGEHDDQIDASSNALNTLANVSPKPIAR
jgi:predicted phage terminase large subunit-like protein